MVTGDVVIDLAALALQDSKMREVDLPLNNISRGTIRVELVLTLPPVSEVEVAAARAATPAVVKVESPLVVEKLVLVPKRLATALTEMWQGAEAQSRMASRNFFAALRDLRYQMVQRRRAVHDAIVRLLTRQDARQNLLEDFRVGFNEIHEDFRFDVDCIAELHLRSLELGDTMWAMTDVRRKEAEELLQQLIDDAAATLSIHRGQCEGTALIQAELNSFSVSLHLLFDYCRAVTSYDSKERAGNPLEETLPLKLSSDAGAGSQEATGKGGKDKAPAKDAKGGKGGKGEAAVAVPFREPLCKIVMPADAMGLLPAPKAAAEVEVVDPKAKGGKAAPAAAKGGKKGAAEEAPAVDPVSAMEAQALEFVATWTKGTFAVQRVVYENNEPICVALESCIWHEAERLKCSIAAIKAAVAEQSAWLEGMEQSLQALMQGLIVRRHAREGATINRLVMMIGLAIEAAEPLREDWLITPDSIAVQRGNMVFPAPAPPPAPLINEFFPDMLNPEQSSMLAKWLEMMRTGSVVLEEDLAAMFDRSLGAVGPLGSIELADGKTMQAIVMPVGWRTDASLSNALKEKLCPHARLQGIDEHFGVVSVDTVLALFNPSPPVPTCANMHDMEKLTASPYPSLDPIYCDHCKKGFHVDLSITALTCPHCARDTKVEWDEE